MALSKLGPAVGIGICDSAIGVATGPLSLMSDHGGWFACTAWFTPGTVRRYATIASTSSSVMLWNTQYGITGASFLPSVRMPFLIAFLIASSLAFLSPVSWLVRLRVEMQPIWSSLGMPIPGGAMSTKQSTPANSRVRSRLPSLLSGV